MRRGADIISLQTILLRRLVSHGSEAEKQAWNSYLSTILGHSMVLQGNAAILQDCLRKFLSTLPSLSTRQQHQFRDLMMMMRIVMDEAESLSDLIAEADLALKNETP